jgi:outer membrane biosynthesis protein TonB
VERGWFALSLALSVGAHLAVPTIPPRSVQRSVASQRITTQVIEPEAPNGRAPRAEPVPEPLETPGTRKPPTESVRRADPASPDQAAELLTSAAGASEPVHFATGAAVLYSGGTTRRDGSSTRGPGMAAEGRPARSSVVGREPSLPDRSPPASLASRPDWRCPFPSQANREGIDSGVATLKVEIDAAGQALSVRVLRHSGHGFGDSAERCALRKRYRPALDRNGRSIRAELVVRVHVLR